MKPTLFLLAAGMGSRYGGLKQLDGLGPNGETIMDYTRRSCSRYHSRWCEESNRKSKSIILIQF